MGTVEPHSNIHDARHLDWEGCVNTRDLGGLPIVGGGQTAFGAVIRSDNPVYLSPIGWGNLQSYGVRTIVALRSVGAADDEPDDTHPIPDGIRFTKVFVEDDTDPDFKRDCIDTFLFGTPIYFRHMLERWPSFCADGVAAVADAEPGAVVVACGRGCDRAGLVSFLLLALANVEPAAIAQDWELSIQRLRRRGQSHEDILADVFVRENTSPSDTINAIVRSMNIEERLRAGGLTTDQIDAVRLQLATT